MEYEKIILDLLVRVKTLEEDVEELKSVIKEKNLKQPGTLEIKEFIFSLQQKAKDEGKKCIILKANDIHKQMKLTSRMPAVCNAMKQCMNYNDEM